MSGDALRVLIANERHDRVVLVTRLVSALGHTVIAHSTDVAAVCVGVRGLATATRAPPRSNAALQAGVADASRATGVPRSVRTTNTSDCAHAPESSRSPQRARARSFPSASRRA